MTAQPKKKFAVRDLTVKRLRDGKLLDQDGRDLLADMIEENWPGKAKSNRLHNRAVLNGEAIRERAALIKSGMSVAAANEKLHPKYGHNSAASFEKWLRRNRHLLFYRP
jgi:hypothetical protein